jgi:hypothetical protein
MTAYSSICSYFHCVFVSIFHAVTTGYECAIEKRAEFWWKPFSEKSTSATLAEIKK